MRIWMRLSDDRIDKKGAEASMEQQNVLVGQSGGPTAVINASLAGVYQNAARRGARHIYGMRNGVQGLLEERIVDLNDKVPDDVSFELLKRTPGAFLGSCRYRLPDAAENEAPYQTIFGLLRKWEIGSFFYIGGNDSMDTIAKLSAYGQRTGSSICFIGVPKTIDNDLILTDHTPGYGSAAKYIAVVMKELILDATVYDAPQVTLVELMGRNAGWLTAAASLARGMDCDGVDMICLPEVPFHVDRFLDKTARMLQKKTSLVIAVSEGVKLEDGRYVCELSDDQRMTDAFGHKSLTGTARYLSNEVAKRFKLKTRSIEVSTMQRCAGHLTSRTDITEAYQVGGAAVKAAMEGFTGQMAAIERLSDDPYQSRTTLVPVERVANAEKKVPLDWINADYTDMLPAFRQYARPLIQAELPPFYIDGLAEHLRL